MIHRVRYGGGAQTLYHVPRDRHGRVLLPASATYSIVALWRHEDDDARTVQASTSATIDSTSTTLSASAGPAQANPRLLPVTSSTGFLPGHAYLLVQGEVAELVECEAADTAQVLVKHELRNGYTTGATLRGIEVTGTFPSDAANDEEDLEAGGGPYGVIWSYTLASVPYYPLEEAWVVRYTTQALITTAELVKRWPMVPALCRGRFNPEDAIAAATDDFLAEVETSGRDPHGLRHSPTTKVCVADRALEYLRRWQQTDESTAHADLLRQDYERKMANLLTGQTPERTAEVKQATDTASRGGSKEYGAALLRRS